MAVTTRSSRNSARSSAIGANTEYQKNIPIAQYQPQNNFHMAEYVRREDLEEENEITPGLSPTSLQRTTASSNYPPTVVNTTGTASSTASTYNPVPQQQPQMAVTSYTQGRLRPRRSTRNSESILHQQQQQHQLYQQKLEEEAERIPFFKQGAGPQDVIVIEDSPVRQQPYPPAGYIAACDTEFPSVHPQSAPLQKEMILEYQGLNASQILASNMPPATFQSTYYSTSVGSNGMSELRVTRGRHAESSSVDLKRKRSSAFSTDAKAFGKNSETTENPMSSSRRNRRDQQQQQQPELISQLALKNEQVFSTAPNTLSDEQNIHNLAIIKSLMIAHAQKRHRFVKWVYDPLGVLRAKDVIVQSIQDMDPKSDPEIDDKDGHYIVKPNANLTSRYKVMRLLGQGTYGKVMKCFDKQEGSYYAVKVIRAIQKYRDASRIELRVLSTIIEHDPLNKNKCIHLKDCFDFRSAVCSTAFQECCIFA